MGWVDSEVLEADAAVVLQEQVLMLKLSRIRIVYSNTNKLLKDEISNN